MHLVSFDGGVMAVYYYFISGRSRLVYIDGKPVPVNLKTLSHKSDGHLGVPSEIRKRKYRNEKYWYEKRPLFVMDYFAVPEDENVEGDFVYYWDPDNETYFDESLFLLYVGRLVRDGRRIVLRKFYTMVVPEPAAGAASEYTFFHFTDAKDLSIGSILFPQRIIINSFERLEKEYFLFL